MIVRARTERRRSALDVVVLAASLGAAGCATPPVTPAQRVDDHHYGTATSRALDPATPDAERREITLDAAHALDPSVEVSVVSPDELAGWVGAKLARRIDPSWVLLRVHTAAAPIDLDQVGFSFSWRATDGVVPVVPPDVEHLSRLTGEHYPEGHSTYRIQGADIPWPVTLLTVGVLDLLSLHTVTNTTPPSDDEIRRAVPLALRFAGLSSAKCRAHGVCDVFLVTRRPANEGADLRLGVSVWAESARGGGVALRSEIPVLPGQALDVRLKQTFASPIHLAGLAQTQMSLAKLDLADCPERPTASAERCAETAVVPWPAKELRPIGIDVPAGPAELGTPKSSRAKSPWWFDSGAYAPDDASLPKAERAQEIATGVPVVLDCRLSLEDYGEDTDSIRATVRMGKEHYEVYGTTFSMPLVRLDAKQPISLEIYDRDTLSGDDWLASMKLSVHGSQVSGSWSASKAHPERGARAGVECDVFGRDRIEPLVGSAYVDAIDAAESAGVPSIDLSESDSGLKKTRLGDLRHHASRIAALVGWDDPRTQRVVEKVDAYDAAFWTAVTEALAREPSAKVPFTMTTDRGRGVEVRSAAARCTPDVARKVHGDFALQDEGLETACAIDIEIANASSEELWPCGVQSCDFVTFSAELEGGRIVDLYDPSWSDHVQVGKTSKGTAYLKTPKADLGKKPIRLIVRGGGKWRALAL